VTFLVCSPPHRNPIRRIYLIPLASGDLRFIGACALLLRFYPPYILNQAIANTIEMIATHVAQPQPQALIPFPFEFSIL
jgi:hypothetical protein